MEYSLESYRRIMERALSSGYAFVGFETAPARGERRIYLRHDVDYSLELALEVARVNASLGIRGTFFVLLRSHIYNLLSSWSLDAVRQIVTLGQDVGLHATLDAGAGDGEAAARALRADFDVARAAIGDLAPVFSWHNPTPEIIDSWRGSATVSGLVNTYASAFTLEIPYYSDSNMRHPAGFYLDLVTKATTENLQLLLHPCLWVVGGHDMGQALAGLWRAVVLSRDQEIRQNRFYRAALPDGMPAPVVDAFVDAWRRAIEPRS